MPDEHSPNNNVIDASRILPVPGALFALLVAPLNTSNVPLRARIIEMASNIHITRKNSFTGS